MRPRDGSYFRWPSPSSHRYSPLDRDEDSSCYLGHRKGSWRSIAVLTSIFAVTLTCLFNLVPRSALVPITPSAGSLNLSSASKAFGHAMDGTPSISVRVQHSYSPEEDTMEMYPWEHTAEPYRKSVIRVTSWPIHLLEEGVEFRWIIGGIHMVGNSSSLDYYFEALGLHQCSVLAVRTESRAGSSEDGGPEDKERGYKIVAEHHFTVMVKYVRREIRSMTDRDREVFFNAVSVIQRVPSAVGQAIYGKRYYSKDFFNRIHLYYGGRRDCDHWHDGPGFTTAHIGVSLMFEQALQAVNPSIALPYWDFTIEGTEYDWTNFRQSSVFSDDWFGSAAPRNEFRTMERGRFAYVPTMANAREYSEVYNAFGLLRSPWNTDPNPFLTRHDHIFGYPNNRKPSGCKQYRDAVEQESWMDLSESFNAGAHGHIHEILGGSWSADWRGFHEKTSERIFPLMHDIVPFMKYLWRLGYLQCPESCTTDLPWKECQCSCADLGAISKTPPQVLEEAHLLSPEAAFFFYDKDLKLVEKLGSPEGRAFTSIPGYSEEETAEIYREVLSVLCTPMKIGTHYEGTSTNDVTFWVLHPTFDRLWHLRRLENDTALDETWEDNDCYGHSLTDIQPLFNLFGDPPTDGVVKKYHTNQELYELLRPDGTTIPHEQLLGPRDLHTPQEDDKRKLFNVLPPVIRQFPPGGGTSYSAYDIIDSAAYSRRERFCAPMPWIYSTP